MEKKVFEFDRNGIIFTGNPVEVVAIYDQFEGAHVAHVKQDIVSKYPKKKFGNSLSSGLFSNGDDAEHTEYVNTRHTLIKVPSEFKSDDEKSLKTVQEKLDAVNGTIQRIVSHNLEDVLTDEDRWAMEEGHFTREDAVERYETRDSENNKYSRGQLRVTSDGEIVDDTLPAEFSRRVYQNIFSEDVDKREGKIVISSSTEEADAQLEKAKSTSTEVITP
jgi:hypothetical protein